MSVQRPGRQDAHMGMGCGICALKLIRDSECGKREFRRRVHEYIQNTDE